MTTNRTLAVAALSAALAFLAGCTSHHSGHAASSHHSPVQAATQATSTHASKAPASKPTADPYGAYTTAAQQHGEAPWDRSQAKEFAGTLCGTDQAAIKAEIDTDWQSVDAGIYSKVDMLNNVNDLLHAYCPARATAVLAQVNAQS